MLLDKELYLEANLNYIYQRNPAFNFEMVRGLLARRSLPSFLSGQLGQDLDYSLTYTLTHRFLFPIVIFWSRLCNSLATAAVLERTRYKYTIGCNLYHIRRRGALRLRQSGQTPGGATNDLAG